MHKLEIPLQDGCPVPTAGHAAQRKSCQMDAKHLSLCLEEVLTAPAESVEQVHLPPMEAAACHLLTGSILPPGTQH